MKKRIQDWLQYYTLDLNSFHYSLLLISVLILLVATPINMICENKLIWIDSIYTLLDNIILVPLVSGMISCALIQRICESLLGKYMSISIALLSYFVLGVLYGDVVTETGIGIVACVIFHYTHSFIYVVFIHSFAKSLECIVGLCHMHWGKFEMDRSILIVCVLICITILIVQFVNLKKRISG